MAFSPLRLAKPFSKVVHKNRLQQPQRVAGRQYSQKQLAGNKKVGFPEII
jgi:hypothetical protein